MKMLEIFWEGLKELLWSIYFQTSTLGSAAIFFLMISIFLNRKNLIDILKKCFPKSLLFNYSSYLLDVFLIITPLGYMVLYIKNVATSNEMIWIDSQFLKNIPQFLILFLVIFVGDFVGYFRHRFEHSRFIWPSHAFHHSDENMTWFTLFRFHPLNRVTTTIIDTSVLIIIGFPEWAILINGLVRHYYGMLIHANLPWTYGALGRIFVSPAMHRWHHVLEGNGIHSNYATVFSIFDQLFKTYYVPGLCDKSLGVLGTNPSFLRQLIYPITVMYKSFSIRSRLN